MTTSEQNEQDSKCAKNSPWIMVDNYLDEFMPLIKLLRTPDSTDNIVVGGMVALHIHGLVMHREPNDMDLIIYQPTPQQKEKLNLLHTITATIPGVEVSQQKIIKILRGGKRLDIIQSTADCPRGLLRFKHSEMTGVTSGMRTAEDFDDYIKIQSIQNTIAAKRGYHLNKLGTDGQATRDTGLRIFVRTKDVADFMELKNNNFNLTDPA